MGASPSPDVLLCCVCGDRAVSGCAVAALHPALLNSGSKSKLTDLGWVVFNAISTKCMSVHLSTFVRFAMQFTLGGF